MKKGLVKYFNYVNWSFPFLLGSQHTNRFKWNTKVFILSGILEGRHGTIIGHGSNFNLKRWGSKLGTGLHHFIDNRSPLLKVLLICPKTGILELHGGRQDTVKLVDLHDILGFASPSLSPWSSVQQYEYIET